MPHPQVVSIEQAITSIPDESCVALGGFDIVRAPMALVFELARQKGEEGRLDLVCPPNPLAVDMLIGAGAVRSATLAFSGFQFHGGFAVGPMWRKAAESKTVGLREVDAYSILCGLRAAAMGAPFIPLTDIEGSELTDPGRWATIEDPFSGTNVTVTRPIQPDVALVHAQAADRKGNLYLEDPIVDELVTKAAHRVIASVEEIVEQLPHMTLPFYLIDSLVEAPRGAWPSACPGHYPADHEHISLYLESAGQGRFDDYYRDYIDKPT